MTGTDMNQILPDIPRIYTALAEWLACIVCILGTRRRLTGWKFAAVSGGFLAVQSLFLILTKGLNDVWWILCMAAAVGGMYIFIYICRGGNWKEALYYCIGAFVVAEFAASFEWQIDCFFYYEMGWRQGWQKAVWLILCYGPVYMFIGWLYRRRVDVDDALRLENNELISYGIIGLAVFLMSNLGFISVQTPFSARYMPEIFNVRTIIDLGGVAILYAYHVQRMDLKIRHELECMQNILHNQYVQYQQSQEAVDIINYKYHDLKHHIIALRAEENSGKREAYLNRMEEEIRTFEAQNKTGNQVIDTLLTAKSLYCMQNDISLTCVVDGTLFDFMEVMDLCSVFGNALDNAIEYEKKIPDKEKRLIHVSAFSQHNFLIMKVENYCADRLEFQEDFPVTTKKDPHFHGYGIKSLRYTARKYGGEVDLSIQDSWFNLKLLIPMKL